MIVLVRKNNLILILMLFLLSLAVYSLNIGGYEALPAANDLSLQKTVMLDPGHGGEDPGAVSDYSGMKEKDINLKIALKLKALLEKDGYRVIMTREEDRLEYDPDTTNVTQKRKQDLLRRKKMMDEGGANIVVSIHLNKFQQTQYFGAQVFYPPDSSESLRLATGIQKVIKEKVDPDNIRVAMLNKEPLIILYNNKTTTVIVECGFLSNANEEQKLATDEYQQKLADAIKDGINNYFVTK